MEGLFDFLEIQTRKTIILKAENAAKGEAAKRARELVRRKSVLDISSSWQISRLF